MRLFIAEKPSVAKAIAAELGITARKDGWIECGDDKVTWCFGHMLELAGPDEYTSDDVPVSGKGSKVWRVEELPIIPVEWIASPKEDAKKQVKIIEALVKSKSVTQVISAGDPDREGNFLIDNLLDYFGNTKPVLRYWSNAIDPVSVNRALASMKDNKEYRGFSRAAEGRAKADWLIGMNMSRAYTLRAKRGGASSLITVGRVQTPTLALVVGRDLEIESFKPVPYHTIRAEIGTSKDKFTANWVANEDQAGLDSEGRLVNSVVATALIELVRGKEGVVTVCKKERQNQKPPLPFSLSGMTALASSKFGYSAEDVLKTCQSLYEKHKLTSYPRTDCTYLPESQIADVPAVLEAIAAVNPEISEVVDGADVTIRSRAFNDSKVSAHHAIIPTMHKGDISKLSEQELNVYDLVVKSYLAQFYPVHEFDKTSIEVDVCGEKFKASGKVVTTIGWRSVFTDSQDEGKAEDVQTIPLLNKGDKATCVDAEKRDVKTKPSPRFTEGTLITAMVNVHRFITEPEHKKLLRDGDGVGTEATRASIISELKRREYLETKGKTIVSTPLGRSLCKALPSVLKSPVLTALYERMLKSVESGEADLSTFIAKQEKFIREQVAKANDGVSKISENEKSKKGVSGKRVGRKLTKQKSNSKSGRATANAK